MERIVFQLVLKAQRHNLQMLKCGVKQLELPKITIYNI